MKVLHHRQDICNGCGDCEIACSKTYFRVEDRNKSAIHIINNNNSYRAIKCTQCGECINMCTAHAIYRDRNGVVRINKKLCVGCLGCVGFCTELAMFYSDDLTEPFKCIACDICSKVCPVNALEVLVSKA
jgi:Fe-S-cluster-containing hydrogenase component 2